MKYRFQVYRCADSHFHFVIGPADTQVTAPFRSFEGGMKLLYIIAGHMLDDDPTIREFEEREVERMKGEIRKLSSARAENFGQMRMRIDHQGCCEDDVFESWNEFRAGRSPIVGHSHWMSGMNVWVPLTFCDFVDRPGEDEARDIQELAELKSASRSLADVGIVLEEVA